MTSLPPSPSAPPPPEPGPAPAADRERPLASFRPLEFPEQPERRSPVTLLAGGALVLALALGGWLLLRDPAPESAAVLDEEEEQVDEGAEPSQPEPAALAARDASRELLDAAQRAQAWHTDAVLAEIRAALVEGGVQGARREGVLEVEYGKPRSGFGPGAPLEAERLLVSYPVDEGAAQKTLRVKGSHIGLPEPNCPLEVAWQKATQSGLPRDQVLQLRYVFEQKWHRAVWKVTSDAPSAARTIDGNSCAVLSQR